MLSLTENTLKLSLPFGQVKLSSIVKFTIENGMISATNFDSTLDDLSVELKKCIGLYEKAVSIFN